MVLCHVNFLTLKYVPLSLDNTAQLNVRHVHMILHYFSISQFSGHDICISKVGCFTYDVKYLTS